MLQMSTELMYAGKQEWQSIHCRGCQVFPVIDKITPVKKIWRWHKYKDVPFQDWHVQFCWQSFNNVQVLTTLNIQCYFWQKYKVQLFSLKQNK